MRKSLAIWVSLLLLCGCTISERGITFHSWNQGTVVPPRPEVDPKPTPIEPLPQGRMRALIIEDVSERHKLTKEQGDMLFETAEGSMRAFIEANSVKDGFRLVDKDTELSGVWAEMKAKTGIASYPLIIFENNGKVAAQLLNQYPTDLLNKFAGVKP